MSRIKKLLDHPRFSASTSSARSTSGGIRKDLDTTLRFGLRLKVEASVIRKGYRRHRSADRSKRDSPKPASRHSAIANTSRLHPQRPPYFRSPCKSKRPARGTAPAASTTTHFLRYCPCLFLSKRQGAGTQNHRRRPASYLASITWRGARNGRRKR